MSRSACSHTSPWRRGWAGSGGVGRRRIGTTAWVTPSSVSTHHHERSLRARSQASSACTGPSRAGRPDAGRRPRWSAGWPRAATHPAAQSSTARPEHQWPQRRSAGSSSRRSIVRVIGPISRRVVGRVIAADVVGGRVVGGRVVVG